jgi:acyl carrier protein phosphodiesterase
MSKVFPRADVSPDNGDLCAIDLVAAIATNPMNFLAHSLLAGERESDRIGGVIGDFVKGYLPAGLSPEIASGVALHRAIDSYADRHPAFIASRARISPLRRRLGGVLVDLFYDHLLAREWPGYGPAPLETYAARLYESLHAYAGFLPEAARGVVERMRRNDWLDSYRDAHAVGLAIDRMAAHRLRQPNALAGGIEEFLVDAEGFAADFRAFLPDALAFAADWRAARGN